MTALIGRGWLVWSREDREPKSKTVPPLFRAILGEPGGGWAFQGHVHLKTWVRPPQGAGHEPMTFLPPAWWRMHTLSLVLLLWPCGWLPPLVLPDPETWHSGARLAGFVLAPLQASLLRFCLSRQLPVVNWASRTPPPNLGRDPLLGDKSLLALWAVIP